MQSYMFFLIQNIFFVKTTLLSHIKKTRNKHQDSYAIFSQFEIVRMLKPMSQLQPLLLKRLLSLL